MKWVYIIRSVPRPEQYYTGLADDVDERLFGHNSGKTIHSAKYRPWILIAAIRFEDDSTAVRFERYLKSGSGRAFAKRHFR